MMLSSSDTTTRRQRLVLLFVGGAVALNYPLLSILSRDVMVAGIPLLYVGLFTLWLLLIAATAWIVRGAEDDG